MTFASPATLQMRRCNAHLRNFAASGGATITGVERRVFSGAGVWEIVLEEIRVWNAAQAWAYEAMLARLRQGEDMVLTLPPGPYLAPFSAAPLLTANAALGATTLNVSGLNADTTAGQKFSIGNRLHQITSVVSEVKADNALVTSITGGDPWPASGHWLDGAAVTSQLTILPPLRAAITTGAACDFKNLRATVRLKDMTDGDLSLDLGRFGSPSLTLFESI